MKSHTVGFELEFEGVSVHANLDHLRQLFTKFGEIKSDLSLNNGFEFASKVARDHTFRGYNNLDESWERLFFGISKLPVEAIETTGMHVHVGRQNLNVEEIGRINNIVYFNRELDVLIGGREPNRYCNFVANSFNEILMARGEKHRFLNVGRPGTIEFRFFKVPTSLNRFLCNMQYVLAIVDFATTSYPQPKRGRHPTPKQINKAFLNHIKKGNYLNLNSFLIEKLVLK